MKSSPPEPPRSRLRAVATLLGTAALPVTTMWFAVTDPKIPPFKGD
jgi:hypothetical protein